MTARSAVRVGNGAKEYLRRGPKLCRNPSKMGEARGRYDATISTALQGRRYTAARTCSRAHSADRLQQWTSYADGIIKSRSAVRLHLMAVMIYSYSTRRNAFRLEGRDES